MCRASGGHRAVSRDSLGDLDQVAAGVIEHGGNHRSELKWFLGESHAELPQAFELMMYVVHAERGEGNPVLEQGLFEWLRRRVGVRLKQQLRARRFLRRDHR